MIGRYVAGEGPLTANVFLCAEGPGRQESIEGRPFVGASGSELTWLYLKRAAQLNRDDLYITNIVKWRTDENDRDPTAEEIARDEEILKGEIDAINPEIIVAVGVVSATWFFASQPFDLEKYYGVPIRCPRYPEKLLLCTPHPAAAIRMPERFLDRTFWSFQQLGRVVRGELGIEEDKYPNPVYKEVERGDVKLTDNPLAVDTEGTLENPWGLSYSQIEGSANVCREGITQVSEVPSVVFHNALYDIPILRKMGIKDEFRDIDDTMLMAYLLPWLPRKLKPLMYKLCRMEQPPFKEMISGVEEKIAKEYLEKVLAYKCERCRGTRVTLIPHKRNATKFREVKCETCRGDGTLWPQPEAQLVFDGDFTGRRYVPRSFGRRVREILERGDRLAEKWASLDVEIRTHAENKLGRMRSPTLDDIPKDKAIDYSAKDADATLRVRNKLVPILKKSGLWRVYEIDKGIIPIIDKMQTNGILIDKEYFHKLDKQFAAEQIVCIDKLSSVAGFTLNPASAQQVGELLYARLRLRPPRGEWVTDEKTLEGFKLKNLHRPEIVESINLITDYRELTKLRGTYVLPLLDYADLASRVHPRFLLHITNTGRLSSRDPNIQNLPTRSERGRLIRKGFIAKPGCVLVSVDLDQIELRVGAHLSEDENMLEIFNSGKDIHRATAALVYGKEYDLISAEERRASKTLNFGIFYGMSAHRLFKELNLLGIIVTLEECQQFIDAWFEAYPGIQDYMDRCHKMALDLGYVESLFGRRRYVYGVWSTLDKIREESLRWAVNHPDQGTAADLLKIWLKRVDDNVLPVINRYGYVAPLATIHDEIVFECERGLESLLIPLVVQEAAQTATLLVPIQAKGVAAYSMDQLK